MFIEKVLRNQKRIDRTIELYEENQKKKQQEEMEEKVKVSDLSEKEAVA